MTSSGARTWLITGVSSGFGRAIADAALARGEIVYGTVRRQEDALDFERLAPKRAAAVLMDLRDEGSIREAVASVEALSGGIDVLVNNAGYGLVAGVEEASLAEVRDQSEVNVFGVLAVMQAALPYMRARRAGHILNITSVSGLVGWPSLGIYTGSKFALEGLSETLALELEPLGIKLTLIEPGGFRTEFAGRSRRVAKRVIADYEPTVGTCRRTLEEHAGHESGDPARAAAAILKVVDASDPPLRLLLGADALGYLDDKLKTQRDEIERWKAVSLATKFETTPA